MSVGNDCVDLKEVLGAALEYSIVEHVLHALQIFHFSWTVDPHAISFCSLVLTNYILSSPPKRPPQHPRFCSLQFLVLVICHDHCLLPIQHGWSYNYFPFSFPGIPLSHITLVTFFLTIPSSFDPLFYILCIVHHWYLNFLDSGTSSSLLSFVT